ncbi:MAG: hypothetical protein Kow0031_33760 [Anaerolineae bacterium]
MLAVPALIALLLITACQPATPPPTATPPPSPTPMLIPPIPRGDGSDLLDRLLDKGIIRVGIRVWPEASFSPPAFRGFSNAAIGGALNGFEVDVAKAIALNLGLELELVEAYPPVIAGGEWRGEWDIAIASLAPFDDPPPNTRPDMRYSRPYALMPAGLLVPQTSPVSGAAQLGGLAVGAFEHSVYQRMLTPGERLPTVGGQSLRGELARDARLLVLSNIQKSIRETEEGKFRADAWLGPAPVFEQAIRENNNLPLRLIRNDEALPPHPLVVAAVPQDGLAVDRLIDEIDTLLARLQRQGVLAELSLKWYGEDISPPE